MDLPHDQFVLEYDAAQMTVARIEDAVRGLGYTPKVLGAEAQVLAPPQNRRVDLEALPPELAAAFKEAEGGKHGVVISFFGHG